VVERVVLASGEHRWRLDLPPNPNRIAPTWISTSELFTCFAQAKEAGISFPKKCLPILNPMKSPEPPCLEGEGWTSYHPLVHTNVVIHLSTSTADWNAAKALARAEGKPPSRAARPQHTFTITAAFIGSDGGRNFFAQSIDDQSISVIFPDDGSVAEAAHAYELGSRSARGRVKGAFGPAHATPGISTDSLPDVAPRNAGFLAAVAGLSLRLPTTDPRAFFGAGFRISSNSIPRRSRPLGQVTANSPWLPFYAAFDSFRVARAHKVSSKYQVRFGIS